MEFEKQYDDLLQFAEGPGHLSGLSRIQNGELKELLKRCRSTSSHGVPSPNGCADCDPEFFGVLTTGVTTATEVFRKHALKLLSLHHCPAGHPFFHFEGLRSHKPAALLQEARALLGYVAMTHAAVLKLLQRYKEAHGGGAATVSSPLRAHLQAASGRLLHSPLLVEVSALAANLALEAAPPGGSSDPLLPPPVHAVGDVEEAAAAAGAEQLARLVVLELPGGAVHTELDLTCPVCLDVVVDPVGLGCGHVMCMTCALDLAHLPAAFSIRYAPPAVKCPLCRQEGVFAAAVTLKELDILVRNRFPEYWHARQKEHRAELAKHAKEYWDADASTIAKPSLA